MHEKAIQLHAITGVKMDVATDGQAPNNTYNNAGFTYGTGPQQRGQNGRTTSNGDVRSTDTSTSRHSSQQTAISHVDVGDDRVVANSQSGYRHGSSPASDTADQPGSAVSNNNQPTRAVSTDNMSSARMYVIRKNRAQGDSAHHRYEKAQGIAPTVCVANNVDTNTITTVTDKARTNVR